MLGIDDAIAEGEKLLDDGINAAFPTPQARASAEATIVSAHAAASLAILKQQMAVMLAEASSTDPWTSRARPSFLYVMYLMILFGIPMGICTAISPETAATIATGMKAWLAAIPGDLWDAFKVGLGGYAIARTAEKIAKVTK